MFKFTVGLILGIMISSASAQMFVHVTSNGVLQDYVVQKNGVDVCKNPNVWNKFRGKISYIVCP